MKTCHTCGETKPLSEYHRHRRSPDGYNTECAACNRARVNAWRALHREGTNAHRRINPEDYAYKGRVAKTPGMKYCPRCKQEKPASAFYVRKSRYDGLDSYCRDCRRERQREMYPSSNWRAKWLERMYGITHAEYERLLASQGDVCKICGKPQTARMRANKLLSVDHDHNTGAVRGLLCDTCNRGLGHFNDDPALLARAIEYLHRSGSVSDRSA